MLIVLISQLRLNLKRPAAKLAFSRFQEICVSDMHSGQCLCGKVSFKTSGKLRNAVACHCGQCRRQTGHYWAATNVVESELQIDGGENVTWYQSSAKARRGFCRHCGSALFWKMAGLEEISIGAGAFDIPSGFTLDQHIYCADKGDYYEIEGDLPRYPQSAPGIVTAN
jgi:hypothetical protein